MSRWWGPSDRVSKRSIQLVHNPVNSKCARQWMPIALAVCFETTHPVVSDKMGGSAVAVRYTPGQLRSAVAISQQTYRHWKKALPPMRRGAGRSPCFSAGDLLAVAIVRSLTADFAIRVGAVSAVAKALFVTCNTTPWPNLERGKLVADLANGRLRFLQETDHVVCERPALVIPLKPIAAHLRGTLLTEDGFDSQEPLRLPPTPLPSKAGPRR